MRYNELTFEATLAPGDVKDIKVKIGAYEEALRELERKQNRMDDRYQYSSDWPDDPALQAKLAAYINAYTAAIKKLKDELKNNNANKPWQNLMLGIQKNCSEIISVYRAERTFLYSGFKSESPALYAKTPTTPVVPHNYNMLDNRFEDFKFLAEDKFGLTNFNHAIFCNGYKHNAYIDDNHATYVIFPVNGYNYFFSHTRERLYVPDSAVPHLLDKDTVNKLYKEIVENNVILEKFIAAGAELNYPTPGDILTPGGFFGRYQLKGHLKAIDTLVKNGDLGKDMAPYADWKNLVSKESFQRWYDITVDDKLPSAISMNHDVFINTPAVYAVNTDHVKYVAQELGFGGWW